MCGSLTPHRLLSAYTATRTAYGATFRVGSVRSRRKQQVRAAARLQHEACALTPRRSATRHSSRFGGRLVRAGLGPCEAWRQQGCVSQATGSHGPTPDGAPPQSAARKKGFASTLWPSSVLAMAGTLRCARLIASAASKAGGVHCASWEKQEAPRAPKRGACGCARRKPVQGDHSRPRQSQGPELWFSVSPEAQPRNKDFAQRLLSTSAPPVSASAQSRRPRERGLNRTSWHA